MTFGSVPSWVADAATIAAAIVAVAAAGTTIRRVVRGFTHGVVDQIDGLIEKHTKPILAELSFNGGGSVKDLTFSNNKAIIMLGEQLAEAASLALEVKHDLDDSHHRADAVPATAHAGTAADAAATTAQEST